jgi:hypothetical protein
MWGKPPFSISDNSVLNVRNLINARDWYKQSEVKMNRQEDSGRPFADLAISNDDTRSIRSANHDRFRRQSLVPV